MGLFPEFDHFKKELARDRDRLFDLLGDIKRNTDQPNFPTDSAPEQFILSSDVAYTNTFLGETSRPYIMFVGNTINQNDTVDLNPSVAIVSIRLGEKANQFFTMRPGDVVATNATKERAIQIYFTSASTLAGSKWLFFLLNQPLHFLRHDFPFHADLGAGIRRRTASASLDSTNFDQYVLFRNPPAVTATLTDPSRVRITDDGINDVDVQTPPATLGTQLGLAANSRNYVKGAANWVPQSASNAGVIDVTINNVSLNVADAGITLPYIESAVGAAGVALTVTITAISTVRLLFAHITAYNTAARVGGAAPVIVTISGFQNNALVAKSLQLRFGSAGAIGTTEIQRLDFGQQVTAIAGTNVVVSCPATASVIWAVNLAYADR